MSSRGPVGALIAAVLCLLTGAALSSCEYKDLCYDHPDHALTYRTRLEATWDLQWELPSGEAPDWRKDWPACLGASYESLIPEMPTGIRVVAYNNENGSRSIHNTEASGGILNLAPGSHSLIFYNNDSQQIVFDEMDSSISAKATSRSRSRSTYKGRGTFGASRDEEYTIGPPDALFGSYIGAYNQEKVLEPPVLATEMKPLVYKYVVYYGFDSGLKYVSISRGALSGMARSVFLHDGHTGPEKATILFDCHKTEDGIEATVESFGIPDYPNGYYTSRSDAVYILNLEVRLNNGKILQFDRDVSEQVRRQPHGGVIIVDGFSIPDDVGNQDGTGFLVDVNDWGDFEDIEIIF